MSLTLLYAVLCPVPHFHGIPFRRSICMVARIVDKSSIIVHESRKDLSSERFFGSGALVIAFTLFSDGFKPSLVILYPKYSTSGIANMHISFLSLMPADSGICKT